MNWNRYIEQAIQTYKAQIEQSIHVANGINEAIDKTLVWIVGFSAALIVLLIKDEIEFVNSCVNSILTFILSSSIISGLLAKFLSNEHLIIERQLLDKFLKRIDSIDLDVELLDLTNVKNIEDVINNLTSVYDDVPDELKKDFDEYGNENPEINAKAIQYCIDFLNKLKKAAITSNNIIYKIASDVFYFKDVKQDDEEIKQFPKPPRHLFSEKFKVKSLKIFFGLTSTYLYYFTWLGFLFSVIFLLVQLIRN